MSGGRIGSPPSVAAPRAVAEPVAEPVAEIMDRAEIEAIARDRLEKARIDILLDHPYFASALLQLPIRGTWDGAIRNAVVTDGSRIVYRFDLVAALLRPKVRLLVLHALAHVLLDHPTRGGARAWPPWTMACDTAVDELLGILGEIEPAVSIKGAHPPGTRSAEEIYDDLARSAQARASVPEPSPLAAPPPQPPAPSATDGMLPSEPPREMDDAERAEREAFLRVAGDAEGPTDLEIDTLRAGFRVDADRAIRAAGTAAGTGSSEIEAGRRRTVDWRSELAQFLRSNIDRSWSLARPNRRHLWRGIYLPGLAPVDGGRIAVAIDTSGSMSDRALGQVLGEIDALRREIAGDLVVLQFDADIQAVAEYPGVDDADANIGSTRIMRFLGRGGTDLCVPFDWAKREVRNGREISALIVCTDGYGPLPERAPAEFPVLFLLTPDHAAPGFGRRLVLPAAL